MGQYQFKKLKAQMLDFLRNVEVKNVKKLRKEKLIYERI